MKCLFFARLSDLWHDVLGTLVIHSNAPPRFARGRETTMSLKVAQSCSDQSLTLLGRDGNFRTSYWRRGKVGFDAPYLSKFRLPTQKVGLFLQLGAVGFKFKKGGRPCFPSVWIVRRYLLIRILTPGIVQFVDRRTLLLQTKMNRLKILVGLKPCQSLGNLLVINPTERPGYSRHLFPLIESPPDSSALSLDVDKLG